MKEIMNPFLQSAVAWRFTQNYLYSWIFYILDNGAGFYSPLMETAADKNDFENYD